MNLKKKSRVKKKNKFLYFNTFLYINFILTTSIGILFLVFFFTSYTVKTKTQLFFVIMQVQLPPLPLPSTDIFTVG